MVSLDAKSSCLQVRVQVFSTEMRITSAEQAAGHEDLLTEILLHLPVKSLLKFKCVSKDWLFLISSGHFCHRHSRRNAKVGPSGLFFPPCSSGFFLLENDNSHGNDGLVRFPSLAFLNTPVVNIIQSCNGLLLCSSRHQLNDPAASFFICNPTTKKFMTFALPVPSAGEKSIEGISLAFDPSKSPCFKVICVCRLNNVSDQGRIEVLVPYTYQVKIYYSEAGTWSLSGKPFQASFSPKFEHGVYWNGAIHWLCPERTTISFDTDGECLKTMHCRPCNTASFSPERFRYFGECCGRLHLVEADLLNPSVLSVLEMWKDRSEWVVKYCFDLTTMEVLFPEMAQRCRCGCSSWRYYRFSVLSVICGEQEDDLTLVLLISDKVISYNLNEKGCKVLINLGKKNTEEPNRYKWYHAPQYIACLSCV